MIRDGYHADLDELREIARGGKSWIARFQAEQVRRTGIPSLKVGFNKVFGYYIEITHAHGAKVPADYIRKQTVKNAERYITPELKEYEEKVLPRRGPRLRAGVRAVPDPARPRGGRVAPAAPGRRGAGAARRARRPWPSWRPGRATAAPRWSDEPVLEIDDGRHPVLDADAAAGRRSSPTTRGSARTPA